MAISFPGSKSNGQKFTSGNKSWTWNGSSWKGSTTTGGDATTFDSLDSSQFLRSDVADNGYGFFTSASINGLGDSGLGISNGSRLGFDQSGTRSWSVKATGGNLAFASGDGSGNLTFMNNTLWHAGNDGSGSGLDADLLDGQQGSYYMPASTSTISQSHQVSGSSFATTGSPGSVLEYQQAASITDTKLAPGTDWYNSIRMGHGNPYSYYSNTIAVKMTGTGVGTLYTQTISNNNAQGWNKHWHDNNDGSGSGLDADTVDGIQGSSFLRSDQEDSGIGLNLNGGSLNQANDATLYVTASNNNDWGMKIDANAASGKTEYGMTIDMPASFSYGLRVRKNGADHFRVDSAGAMIGGNYVWHAGNDGSGSGLDADTLDGLHASDLGGGATVSTTAPSSPSQGDMWFNSTTGVTAMYVWSGTQWDQMSNKFSATGGTVTTYSAGGLNYKIHTFTSSGTFNAEAAGVVDILMVAGGGGGGGHANPGGAGAGGLIYISSHGVTPGSFTITIGAGGVNTNTGTYATAVKGNDTTGIGLTAKGGGAGVVWSAANLASLNGGSSGGYGTGGSVNTGASTATQPTQAGDSGVHGFGNRGGNGTYFGNPYPGGGGGGAGAVGQNSPGGSTAGAGGAGRTYDISGTSTTYAGGGGGGGWSSVSGMAGGAGGGGRGDCALSNGSGTSSRGFTNNSSIGENGSINTGGGGGGAGRTGGQLSRGGNGGSGIVIIRYLV